MRMLGLAAATALFALPAHATTYHFSYSVGASTGGSYYDLDTGAKLDSDVQVTGFVETDGTTGNIDENNIVSWEFTISGDDDTLTIGSDAAFGYWTRAVGAFNATASTLTAIGAYQFAESEYEFDRSTGQQDEYIVGNLYGDAQSGGQDRAYVYGWTKECTASGGCSARDAFGDSAKSNHLGATQFVGTAQPAPAVSRVASVPLPAGLPLLAAGLGALALLRRRQKA